MSVGPDDPTRAIALKVTSVLLFVVMASLIKATSAEVPPGEAVFFRSLFALPVILVWVARRGSLREELSTTDPLGHLWRGLIGTASMAMSFAGLAILPLYEVKAIQYAMPLFVVILAAILLGETVRYVRIAAIALGMAGVLTLLWPRMADYAGGGPDLRLAIGAAVVLSGSFCAAMAQIFVRRLVETEHTAAIVFWFSVTATLLSVLTVPFGWALPSAGVAAALVLAGVSGGLGQICLTASYRFADASVIAPFEYISMVFAAAVGFFVFGELPTQHTLAGAVLVIAAGLLIILRERHLNIRRGRAAPYVTKFG